MPPTGSIAPWTSSAPVNENIVINTTKYAQKKKLWPEQLLEINAFLTMSLYLCLSLLFWYFAAQDAPGQHQTKLFINQLALANQLKKIIAAVPAFLVSNSLKLNILLFHWLHAKIWH